MSSEGGSAVVPKVAAAKSSGFLSSAIFGGGFNLRTPDIAVGGRALSVSGGAGAAAEDDGHRDRSLPPGQGHGSKLPYARGTCVSAGEASRLPLPSFLPSIKEGSTTLLNVSTSSIALTICL